MSYIEELGKLVCSQVDKFIIDVMRQEKDGDYQRRQELLLNTKPTDQNANTDLFDKNQHPNNDPYSKINLIDLFSTPFDYIDRIYLQDFSNVLGLNSSTETDSYFRKLFTPGYTYNENHGNADLTSMEMNGSVMFGTRNQDINYDVVNSALQGEFVIDSFTYSPFIDYSQIEDSSAIGDSRVGIYQDEYLTKYNTGWFDDKSNDEVNSIEVDVNRRVISSNLFNLRNLEQDIYDAKISFRQAVNARDEKTYIYTFCEHLLTLFAKLSNIRMSHLIYGLKTPHTHWEGILALDIWYQMLYGKIDCGYAFNDDYLDRNPMSKLILNGDKVSYGGQDYPLGYDKDGIHVFSDTNDPGVEPGFGLLWDESLYSQFKNNAKDINNDRKEHVLPRGVLKKIYDIVNDGIPTKVVSVNVDGVEQELTQFTPALPVDTLPNLTGSDFSWFYQKGKVYSDSSKSVFTKYTNLHLGLAYDVMTPREYYSLGGLPEPVNGKYTKPVITDLLSSEVSTIRYQMVRHGCLALQDAFSVIKNERLFNIYNNETNKIEEFNPNNAKNYTQAQCAIVIERVFSRLYKYLSIKSTTTETFARHINIDSGYKYLTSDTILQSDNINGEELNAYYSQDDDVPYLRYLSKIQQYINEDGKYSGVLTQDEVDVLKHVYDILLEHEPTWMTKGWNLCPLCQEEAKKISRMMSSRAIGDESFVDENVTNTIILHMNTNSLMNLDSSQIAKIPGNQIDESKNIFSIDIPGSETFDASNVVLTPTYTTQDKSVTVDYKLEGFSTSADDYSIVYDRNYVFTSDDFNDTVLSLYAIWSVKPIIRYNGGSVIGTNGSMEYQPVNANTVVKLNKCGFVPVDDLKYPLVKYFASDSSSGVEWDEVTSSSGERYLYEFDHWEYTSDGHSISVKDQGEVKISIKNASLQSPEVNFVAKWRKVYDVISFKINDQKYCDALVEKETQELPQTINPSGIKINGDEYMFQYWDKVTGSILGGTGSADILICNGDSQIICGTDPNPIICQDYGVDEYTVSVNAILSISKSMKFTIEFHYLNPALGGDVSVITEYAEENSPVPRFHIHDEIRVNGTIKKFRYWLLESGNLSSELTLLSNLVFVAVYDDVGTYSEQVEQKPVIEPVSLDLTMLPTVQDFTDCEYCSKDTNRFGVRYCTFTGFLDDVTNKYYGNNPGKEHNRPFDIPTNCPYLELIKSMVNWKHGDEERGVVSDKTHKDKKNDFDVLSVIDISDVSKLLTALLKINLHIAHNEYYLKIDIPEPSNWWYGYNDGGKWISFEPTVEYKFSNMHASNQVVGDKLVCTVDDNESRNLVITPINRELLETNGIHWNEYLYFYDYWKTLNAIYKVDKTSNTLEDITPTLSDEQKYYTINPLCLYENSSMQSPVDVNGFVKHRLNPIVRTNKQVQTYTSIVKKYRPVIIPSVRDIFNDCINDSTKYQVDIDNSYGVFGWCSIPSKTMVNMEYNEHSIIVPSTYDHHNRVGGSNFLQMDKDLYPLYHGSTVDWTKLNNSNIKNTWYYLYNRRDWTYFLEPLFDIKPNSDIYGYMKDTYDGSDKPENSDHINGIIFEPTILGRNTDTSFGMQMSLCQVLARYCHIDGNIQLMAKTYDLLSYSKLIELTQIDGEFNSRYGSIYDNIPSNFRFPDKDWIDDYNKTGSYLYATKYITDDQIICGNQSGDIVCSGNPDDIVCKPSISQVTKYRYCLGQSHAIDDFDEDSVWLYITVSNPVEEIGSITIDDIMPFVFWWSNRGVENNGPIVNCYGRQGNAKLNYEDGGYCYESSLPGNPDTRVKEDDKTPESLWHSVQHTLGVDFSKMEYGGVMVNTDNTGNCYKAAFDPNCAGTDEKWKIHHQTNCFGSNQSNDLKEDKYYNGNECHQGGFEPKIDEKYNTQILKSLEKKPMSWNLWNIVRHYCYIRYFKNQTRELATDSDWIELENRTEKLVRGIYRTYKEKCSQTFSQAEGAITNYGSQCLLKWTNSFAEIQSIMERNERKHDASLVLYTGDVGIDTETDVEKAYATVKNSTYNFVVTTLDGVESYNTGITQNKDTTLGFVYNGNRFSDLPVTILLGNVEKHIQRSGDLTIDFVDIFDQDLNYPESEYKPDGVTKWVRRMYSTMMSKQMLPLYTTMELFVENYTHHQLSVEQLKSFTFQVIPQLYWKYEWSYNKFMIHRVGKLMSPNQSLEMYDMLGNVWEWVRDDWSDNISALNAKKNQDGKIINPIVGKNNNSSTIKVIKGGAFDQLCRKVISASREGLETNKCQSQFGTQANVGFRPSFTYTVNTGSSKSTVDPGEEGDGENTIPTDLFFLFDASASQNTEFGKMLEQALSIVKQYAGNSDNKDICNVGSALFMGASLKLICGNHIGTKREVTRTSITWASSSEHPDVFPDDVAPGKVLKNDEINSSFNKFMSDMRNQYWNGTIANTPRSAQAREFSLAAAAPVARGDGAPSGTDSSSNGDPAKHVYTQYYNSPRHLSVFSGVNVYCDSSLNLRVNASGNPLFTTGKLFNYNPEATEDAMREFEFPFAHEKVGKTEGYRGCISNRWAGCEDVCTMLQQLISTGMFRASNQPSIGYLFRKNTRKLIFVFSNEFDNELFREIKKDITHSHQVFPTVDKKGKVVLNRVSIGTPKNNVVKDDVKYWNGDYRTEIQEPPDPFCMQLLHETSEDDVESFIKETLNVDDFTNAPDDIKEGVTSMFGSGGIKSIMTSGQQLAFPCNCTYCSNSKISSIELKGDATTNGYGISQNISKQLLLETMFGETYIKSFDKVGEGNSSLTSRDNFTGVPNEYVKIINGVIDDNYVKGDVQSGKIKRIRWDALRTSGFYKLNRTFRSGTATNIGNANTQIFILVNNAAAPVINNPTDPCLYQYRDLFVDLCKEKYTCGDDEEYTYWDLYQSNMKHFRELKKEINISNDNCQSIADVFGLSNPWKSQNIVWAERNDAKLDGVTHVIGLPLAAEKKDDSPFDSTIATNSYANVKKLIDYLNGKDLAWKRSHITTYKYWQDGTDTNAHGDGTFWRKFQTLETCDLIFVKSEKDIINNSVGLSKGNNIADADITFLSDNRIRRFMPSTCYMANSTEWDYGTMSDIQGSSFWNVDEAKQNSTIYLGVGNSCVKTDFVTQEYKSGGGATTGVMKIICMRSNGWGNFDKLRRWAQVKREYGDTKAWTNVVKTLAASSRTTSYSTSYANGEYPVVWKIACSGVAFKNNASFHGTYPTWSVTQINDVKTLFSKLQKTMPIQMTYRYYKYIIKEMKNADGFFLNDTDKENSLLIKALPIYSASNLKTTVAASTNITNLVSSGNISYKYAIVHLNGGDTSSITTTSLPSGNNKYIEFITDIDNINVDEYKTDKILFTRVNKISASAEDEAVIGSHASDYDEVTDEVKLRYADKESILSRATDDNATVTLKNGGSWQNNAMYDQLDTDEKSKKYKRNKHFFIDPFALTISQWCYAHGWIPNNECNTDDKKKTHWISKFGGGKYNEMASSYWLYIKTWETDEYKQIPPFSEYGSGEEYAESGKYNPLEDTRPYYYSTYSGIRDTSQIISSDSANEYQMNERTSGTSFLDILNNEVNHFTNIILGYGDILGGTPNFKMNGEKIADPEWGTGKSVGLNFDLPTEAQWEYCCRQGSVKAFPPNYDLGQTYDTENKKLSQIAWYKYKYIGILPEPERFVTWRISKMLFGISKDKEQVNNVYEVLPD